jgi:SAM-dependent methyltransferase
MAAHYQSSDIVPVMEEIPERQGSNLHHQNIYINLSNRLDEQHFLTTKTLGFLVHPNISIASPTAKIADVGTGTGIWLLDVAKSLPSTCEFTGFDVTPAAFPPPQTLPPNVSFKIQDMLLPFPASELGTYDVVATRFTSVATTRSEWARAVENLATLLKPGGWLQWIDSCNFTLYNTVAGTSRAACQEIYDALEPLRSKDDVVIGMMMRQLKNLRREEVFRDGGLVDVHEDVFSTDRLQDAKLELRDKGTRNAITCFLGCLEHLIEINVCGWSKEKIEKLKEKAMREIDNGAYHTLDQVCIVGRKA